MKFVKMDKGEFKYPKSRFLELFINVDTRAPVDVTCAKNPQ